MCDERDASRMSGVSTAKRNGLTGRNIIRMVQLQQYWRYGYTDQKYTHSASLTLPKLSAPSESIQLPAPTLNDLLNPANHFEPEEAIFAIHDPYGTRALDKEEEDEDEEDFNIPFNTRTNLTQLEIEELVDLHSPKLRARFEEDSTIAKPNAKEKSSQPSNVNPAKWTDADAKWDANGISW